MRLWRKLATQKHCRCVELTGEVLDNVVERISWDDAVRTVLVA